MTMDLDAFEKRYRQLENRLGEFSVGEAVRMLAELPLDDTGWDNVITSEVRRCVDLYKLHYKDVEAPPTVTVSRRPLQISHSHDELMATIGFVQGATFVVAALREQGLLKS